MIAEDQVYSVPGWQILHTSKVNTIISTVLFCVQVKLRLTGQEMDNG
jgi:ABC-type proline/glycine betaine transport system permease subunit